MLCRVVGTGRLDKQRGKLCYVLRCVEDEVKGRLSIHSVYPAVHAMGT